MQTGTTLRTRFDAFKKHLRGVKQRLIWVLFAWGLGTALTAWYRAPIIGWLIAPAHGRLSPTGYPIVTGVMDAFNFTIHMSIMGGIILAAPVAGYQIFWFISPLLGQQKRRFLAIFLPMALAQYIIGVTFSYFLVLPLVLRYMLNFSTGVATPMITLSEYMDLAQTLLLWLGVVFELPLLMFMLAKFRIVGYDQFKKLQPYVPAASFILAALISATLEFTIPITLIVLFEVGLLLSWLVRPKQSKGVRVP